MQCNATQCNATLTLTLPCSHEGRSLSTAVSCLVQPQLGDSNAGAVVGGGSSRLCSGGFVEMECVKMPRVKYM